MDNVQRNVFGDTEQGLLAKIRAMTDQRLEQDALFIDPEPDLRRVHVLSLEPGDALPYANTEASASIFVHVTTKLRRDEHGVLWAKPRWTIHICSYSITDPNDGASPEVCLPEDDLYYQVLDYQNGDPEPNNAIHAEFL